MDIAMDVDGHILVIPKKHINNILDCDEENLFRIIKTVKKVSEHLVKNCGYDGVDLLNATGEPAGQTIPHFHIHIIPRRKHDGLGVFRQIISNWENNKNLPDLELVVLMSKVFSLSLNQLILGGSKMNNMTEKLIKDGSETRRAKFNLITVIVGVVLLCIGVACLIIKGLSVEYIDERGFLHENFFLIPIGFLFIFSSIITFCVAGVKKLFSRIKKK